MQTLTPREAELFFHLLTLRHFPMGSEVEVAKLLDGSGRSRVTNEFIKKMITFGCLKYEGSRPLGRRDIPVYSRDKRRMREFFEGTIYYRMAQEFVVDPIGDILRNDADPFRDMAQKIVSELRRRKNQSDAGGSA